MESIIAVLTLRVISTVSKHIGEPTMLATSITGSEFVTIDLGKQVHLTDENFETSHDLVDSKFEPSSHDKTKPRVLLMNRGA